MMKRTQTFTRMEVLLEDVKTFTYIGATLKSGGSSDNELRIRLKLLLLQ